MINYPARHPNVWPSSANPNVHPPCGCAYRFACRHEEKS
jgi:hypothetical protein